MNLPRPKGKTKVLLIRLSSLGDVVLSTAAVGPLKAAGYSVCLATKSEFASLFSAGADFEQIYSFDKKVAGGEAAARDAFLSWAREQGFAGILDLQNSWRTWSWRGSLRKLAPVRALGKPRIQEWLVLVLRLGRWFGFQPGGRALRFRQVAEAALSSWGSPASSEAVPAGAPLTRISAGEAEQQAVDKLLPPGDFVALLPASAWHSKEWPYFPELAGLLAKKVPVVVLGGAKDHICAQVAEAAAAVNTASRSLHGKTSMRESVAVLARARWVIGNDTGMVHVAEALGKDVAMVEGPTHSFMGFSPYRERSVLLGLDLVCRPCSKSGKICVRFGTRLCLKGLKVADVASRLRERGYPC